MTTFVIKLFGAIEITRDGVPLTDFRSQKALVLLAYLISEGRSVTRDYLAGLAWPEVGQQQALGLLRRTLHDLTSKLPGCLVVDRRTVHFQVDPAVATVDVGQFAALAVQEDPAAWEDAFALYRAPFLEGIYLDDAAGLEGWLTREQERWQAQAVHLLVRLIDHYQMMGEYGFAVAYAQRLVALEPWREEAHSRLMLLLARTGQLSAALAQYRSCRQALWQELGVEPAQRTQLLYARLRDVVQRSAPQLPLPPTPFMGRDDEVVQLSRWLADPACRLITVVGVGGLGKTRLALAVAHAVCNSARQMFLYGAYFIPLAGIDEASQLPMTVAQALGVTLQGRDAPDERIFSHLRDKELLLVLDNFEQLIGERSLTFLARLLEAAPEVKVLATSRSRLGLHCEQLYWLQGLQTPNDTEAVTIAAAHNYSAIQLWLATARRYHPEYAVTAVELPSLIAIATQVEGLPLALELAAAWRGTLSAADIATAVARNLDFLSTNAPDLPSRQRSMSAIFQTSWHLLTPQQQGILSRLAVFRGGFTAELAWAVAGADKPMLYGLLDKSLVYQSDEVRFNLHELVRHFAAEQLTAAEQMLATQARHAQALLSFVEAIEPASRHVGERPGLAALQREYENIQAALQWAFTDGEPTLGLALTAAMRNFWLESHRWREGCHWHAMALAVPTTDQTLLERAIVLNEWGELLGLMGENQRAYTAHREALRLFAQLGEAVEHAWSLYYLAVPEYQNEDHAYCNQLLFRALETFRREEDERGIATILQRLTLQMVDGDEDLERAEAFAAESLAIARRLDLRLNMAGTLVLLGEILIRRADLVQAEAYLTESCRLSAPGGGVRSWAMGKLGHVLLKRGKLAEAQVAFQEVLRIRQALGSMVGVAWMLEALGEVAVARAEHTQAVRMFGAAAALRAKHGQPLLAVDKRTFEELLVKSRTALGADCFTTLWQQGEELAQVETDFAALFGQSDEEEPASIND